MPVTQDASGPYAPSSAVVGLIERHRNKGLPSPIVADTLARAGVSDSLIPRTLQALTTLDLIDGNGNPTETLEGLRKASDAAFRDRMADWLRSAYSDALKFIEPESEETEIRDAFRSYTPIGQQSRMVSLFTGLMSAAGLREKSEKKPPVRTSSSSSTATKARKPHNRQQDVRSSGGGAGGAFAGNPKVGLPPVLAGLLQSLPSEGGNWTQKQRDKFIATFEAVIDFCYRIEEDYPHLTEQKEQ